VGRAEGVVDVDLPQAGQGLGSNSVELFHAKKKDSLFSPNHAQ